jgi:hypothetical protein
MLQKSCQLFWIGKGAWDGPGYERKLSCLRECFQFPRSWTELIYTCRGMVSSEESGFESCMIPKFVW